MFTAAPSGDSVARFGCQVAKIAETTD